MYVNLRRIYDSTTAGGETHIIDLVESLKDYSVEAFVFYPQGRDLYIQDLSRGLRHKYEGSAPVGTFKDRAVESAFRKAIREHSIDIVHFQNFQTLPLSLASVARAEGRKVVFTVHDYFLWCDNFTLLSPVLEKERLSFCFFESDPAICSLCLRALGFGTDGEGYVSERREFIGQMLRSTVDRFVFPSEYAKVALLSLYRGIEHGKCRVIEHGVVKPVLPAGSAGSTGATGSAGLAGAAKRPLNVAFLGTFREAKGSTAFNAVVERLGEREDIGFFTFGRLEDPVPSGIGNINCSGEYNRRNLPAMLGRNEIDVILLLSPWAETYSYTLSEAVVNGVPVVATDLGALRERVAKHGVGYLVPYDDPAPGTVKILEGFLAHPEILEHFKQRCRAAAGELREIGQMAADHHSLYEGLL